MDGPAAYLLGVMPRTMRSAVIILETDLHPMPIETTAVTPDQVRRILAREEGHFFDLKAIEIAPSKLTKTIAAFANASGGELYIGVAEVTTSGVKSRAWRGFADMEAANAHLQV